MTSKLLRLRAGLSRRATVLLSCRVKAGQARASLNRIPNRGDSIAIHRIVPIGAILVLAAVIGVPQGCTNPGIPDRPPRSGEGAPVVTVEADWDDIDAAIARAAPGAAVALLSNDYTDSVERVIRLLSADGQTVRVRLTTRAGDDPRPIMIEATYGAPDDAQRSAALVRLIADELQALAGRAIAPR